MPDEKQSDPGEDKAKSPVETAVPEMTPEKVSEKVPEKVPEKGPEPARSRELDPQELVSSLTEVERIELVPFPEKTPDSFLAVVLVKDSVKEIEKIGEELVARAASRGHTLYPALYKPAEWKALEQAAPQERWLECLGGGARARAALIELHRTGKQAGGFPKSLRRMLIKSIRNYLSFFDYIQRSVLFPRHINLAFCAEAMREALDLLFATKGASFSAEPGSLALFEEHFADGPFDKGDALLFFQLRGMAEQARHFYQLKVVDEPPFSWLPTIKRCCRFLEAFERYAHDRFTTAEERRRIKLRRRLLAGGIALFVVAAVAVYVVLTWPDSSTVTDAKISRPGGIVGQYFNGKNFEKKVLARTDSTINLVTKTSPAAGVNADRFSVRWEGYVFFPETGDSHLCTESDDGVRLFFNNTLLIENWNMHATIKDCAMVRVQKGWYPIKLEFYDERADAKIRLMRGKDQNRAVVVPAAQLCCRQKKQQKKKKKK